MTLPSSTHETHLRHLHHCITLARQSPPKPTNYRVGCVIVSHSSSPSSSTTTTDSPLRNTDKSSTVLSTGYTLETPGNTHAEQNALSKLNLQIDSPVDVTLYTSLEPCSLRLSGNTPCVQRIIATHHHAANNNNTSRGFKIQKVIFGAKEPNTFVRDSQSCKLLTEAGVEWEYIPDLEEEILRVAMEGHVQKEEQKPKDGADEGAMKKKESVFLHDRIDAMANDSNTNTNTNTNNDMNMSSNSEAARKLQEAEAQPRNPKKRMMETIP